MAMPHEANLEPEGEDDRDADVATDVAWEIELVSSASVTASVKMNSLLVLGDEQREHFDGGGDRD